VTNDLLLTFSQITISLAMFLNLILPEEVEENDEVPIESSNDSNTQVLGSELLARGVELGSEPLACSVELGSEPLARGVEKV